MAYYYIAMKIGKSIWMVDGSARARGDGPVVQSGVAIARDLNVRKQFNFRGASGQLRPYLHSTPTYVYIVHMLSHSGPVEE